MYEEDRRTHSLRARHSPVPGGTPEAEELALWLNKIAGGRTVRQMESRFRYGRTQWSDFLRGRKLIPLWLLNNVVVTLVPPEHQQLHLARGHELLRKAELAAAAAAASRAAASPVPPGGSAREHMAHLKGARQGQGMARDSVQSLSHLVQLLTGEIQELDRRCKSLEDELAQARQQSHHERIAAAEQRLAEIEQRVENYEEKRTLAQQGQREAEELRIEAFWKTEDSRLAVERLTGQEAPPDPADATPGLAPAPLWDGSHVLDITATHLDTQLNAIRVKIGLPAVATPEEPRIIHGRVVPSPSPDRPDGADRADNASADGDPVRTPSTDRADTDTESAGEHPSASPGNERQDNRAGTGPGQATDRPRRKRRGARIALIGTALLALLAGGGVLAWNHYQPGYDRLDSKAVRDAERRGFLKIGVKNDQPGLSEQKDKSDPLSWEGFDIGFARNIGKALGFEKITFIAIPTADREDALTNKKIDLFVGSYSITKKRKDAGVAFAGPYLSTISRPWCTQPRRTPRKPTSTKRTAKESEAWLASTSVI
ncbi:transporter substrate-binding domain-containing protein [Streptomyces sp. OspMP-M43]|uniref:transporter substrate-binding domain-containing protein n=1 Tax=Streptomyces sp. OspMP-M43 TaxID=1839781 RepID=UPI00081B7101|nr:transporter substrate-binding domain-containing protein [Streptomyces sp. OspMP-M43]SCE62031.1 extracellular solute-binding protein, family 3 [Streptomyces sp. OspMP-M43]